MISIFRQRQTQQCPSFMSESTFLGSNSNSYETPILPVNYTVEDLTRDVYVKPLHSHNDYWRTRPLFDAMSVGAVSVESDIWYFPNGYEMTRTVTETSSSGKSKSRNITSYFKNNEIYVGHSQIFLEPIKTLFNLYLNPLFQFLQYVNPEFAYIDGNNIRHTDEVNTKNSVYYNSPEVPMYFWFDFKTEAEATYEALLPLLQPFIDNNYLAYYDTKTDTFHPGPLILTITGNLPTDKVKSEPIRYTFLDGPLQKFKSGTDSNELEQLAKLSKVASASLEELLGDEYETSQKAEFTALQKKILKEYFDTAHKYSVKTRIWGDVTWPERVRDSHLKDMFELGCDLLNVDDLNHAKSMF
ncbi:uncharacterized protein SPAPADRAFT_62212 [Spathaspora passalidarum NRRL Y-27907]|uniref:Altered inheritance of mitochondria protein 6 n=1 Tax=Spathaspora passalidarum (strain NRRL Y-27907 / 11-Y1) TaxID=619300 RepID=G3AQQ5_SPAPN|nr:uncharacterized protein SPAPADRAFT_62212 [Spathaspora passalidarum NRRL Y-27907]EGW31601.1 hypothetical protein SPAPADRAFT_62212 [Spathaspora passalidarum NRRL Y-27907]